MSSKIVRKLISLSLAISAAVPSFAINSHAYDPWAKEKAPELYEKAAKMWNMACDMFPNSAGGDPGIFAAGEALVEGGWKAACAKYPGAPENDPQIFAEAKRIIGEVFPAACAQNPGADPIEGDVCAAMAAMIKRDYLHEGAQVLDPQTFAARSEGRIKIYRTINVSGWVKDEPSPATPEARAEMARKGVVTGSKTAWRAYRICDCIYARYRDVEYGHHVSECAEWFATRHGVTDTALDREPGLIVPFCYDKRDVREMDYQMIQTTISAVNDAHPEIWTPGPDEDRVLDPRAMFLNWCMNTEYFERAAGLMGVQVVTYAKDEGACTALRVVDESNLSCSSENISTAASAEGLKLTDWSIALGGGRFTTGSLGDPKNEIIQL